MAIARAEGGECRSAVGVPAFQLAAVDDRSVGHVRTWTFALSLRARDCRVDGQRRSSA
jgi:hypothetical protein